MRIIPKNWANAELILSESTARYGLFRQEKTIFNVFEGTYFATEAISGLIPLGLVAWAVGSINHWVMKFTGQKNPLLKAEIASLRSQ